MSNITEQRKPTPLPRLQLFIIYLIQFAEPITAQVIYPFVNQFVRETGINKGDETKTGYYAGVIESAFFLAEALTVVQWGYLSDKSGRRPVLLLGPLGLSASVLMFGLSTTFWPLVLLRCLQGTFNGNIGVSKTVIAEITDDTNIGDAYAYGPFIWSTGTTLGPIIGGILSHPAERWPDTFGRLPLFKAHPYFLPCATASCIVLLSLVIAFFALEETLPSIVMKREQTKQLHTVDAEASLISHSDNVNYGAITSTIGGVTESAMVEASPCPTTTGEETPEPSYALFHRPLLLVFLNYIFLAFLSMCNSVLIPLMYSTPLEYGGLGLSPFAIGIALGTFGIINAIVQIKFMGPLLRRFGPEKLFKFAMMSPCVAFMLYPVMKHAAQKAGRVDGSVIVLIMVHLASRAPLFMAYGVIQVLIVRAVPEGGLLGTVNGIGQMLASSMRAIAPTVASSLFSISSQTNLADGNLVYYCLFGIALLGARLSWLSLDPAKARKENGSDMANGSTS